MSEIIELPEMNTDMEYTVWYRWRKNLEDEFDNGMWKGTVDRRIGSLEQIEELARHIGQVNGYAQIYISMMFPEPDNMEEILENSKDAFGNPKAGKIVD